MSDKTKAVGKVEPAGALVPADLADSKGQGTEGIGARDVRPPRLSLAQSQSRQVKKNNPLYIEGLKEGDLFNDLTGEIYGEPVDFVVVRYLGKRAMEFAPMETGGGVVDFDVALDDVRCQWTTDEKGKRLKPIATVFSEYLIWLTGKQELAALSMKGTQLKVATQLNSLLKLPLKIDGALVPRPPSWAREFQLGSAMASRDPYTWATFTLRMKGVSSEETRKFAAELYEQYRDVNVVIEAEPESEPEPAADTEL